MGPIEKLEVVWHHDDDESHLLLKLLPAVAATLRPSAMHAIA